MVETIRFRFGLALRQFLSVGCFGSIFHRRGFHSMLSVRRSVQHIYIIERSVFPFFRFGSVCSTSSASSSGGHLTKTIAGLT